MEHHSHTQSRRRFLKSAAAAVALPYFVEATALGADGRSAASERIMVGAIGLGERGCVDLRGMTRAGRGQALAVCDVNRERREQVAARYGDCAAYVDFRELCARDDIDVVVVATPDHWHALCSIEAMRNGKDVYCEKPLALTIAEGRAMVDTARTYGRVLSCGSQVVHWHCEIARRIQKGEFGQIRRAYVRAGKPSLLCDLPAEPVPDRLDWDMWLGPAPWAPYHSYRYSRTPGVKGQGWRSWRDYSGGEMTDWGAHHIGSVMFALGLDHTGPVEIIPAQFSENRKTTHRFACGVEICLGSGPGVTFKCATYEPAEGDVPGLTWQPPQHLLERECRSMDDTRQASLITDFLHCVRTRERPFRHVEYAHRAATVCHLSNIVRWLNRPLKWDPDAEEFIGDDEANRLTRRSMREPWRLG
jgi:hypothetical protein